MITFDHVKVVYDGFEALPDFNLGIEEGEFFTLLGPSGCGKSTALRTLAGFINPADGRILVDEKDVTHAHSSKRGIGMVFQNYALFPSMNVRENIAFGLKTVKTPAPVIRSRVAEAAELVDLSEGQLDKQVSDLSGGQQQRVAIARALITKPSILLLDEPLSNLDARLRKQLRVQLKELQNEVGITTLYVTHDQEEALSLSDRIALLNEGSIEQVGTPQELYDSPKTEFVATFLGEVNKISNAQVVELNYNGAHLNPDYKHYIRLEKISVSEDPAPQSNYLMLPATVQSSEYFGNHSVYHLDCLGSLLKTTSNDMETPYVTGKQLYLSFQAQALHSFDESGHRVVENGAPREV